jgi:hypothetical protein
VNAALVGKPLAPLVSMTPLVMLPVPSATKLPAWANAPLPLNPLTKKAKFPFNLALLGLLPMITVAEADLVESATEVAVTVTVEELGTAPGAV